MNVQRNIEVVPATVRGFYLNRTLAAIAATVLTAVWIAAAQPARAGDLAPSSTTVSYADLDLHSQAGARVLYQRLKSAAERVCDGADHRTAVWQQCYDTALTGAVIRVGAPTLLALHRSAGEAHSG
jgi:UrcA family protein